MLFLDLETTFDKKLKDIYTANIKPPSNYKDQTKISEWLNTKYAEAEMDMALDQDFSDIACIAVAEDDQDPRLVNLYELIDLLNKHYDIVTFNGKNFDIPIIIKQCIKQGITFPRSLLYAIQKYKTDVHKDLCEILAMNGSYKSMDTYLKIYLGIEKTPIDFATCTKDALELHCIEDVLNLQKLYKKFGYMFI